MITLKKRMAILFLAGLLALLQGFLPPALAESGQEGQPSVAVESYHDRTYVFRMTVPGLKASYSVNAPETPMYEADFVCRFTIKSDGIMYDASITHWKFSEDSEEFTPASQKGQLFLFDPVTLSSKSVAKFDITIQDTDVYFEVVFPNDFDLTRARITSAGFVAEKRNIATRMNLRLPYDDESVSSYTGQAVSTDSFLSEYSFGEASENGFTIGYPVGDQWKESAYRKYGYLTYNELDLDTRHCYLYAKIYQLDDSYIPGGYSEDPEEARKMLEDKIARKSDDPSIWDFDNEFIDIDGHPAYLESYTGYGNDGLQAEAVLFYPRGDRILKTVIASVGAGTGETKQLANVELADLRLLASKVRYNADEAPLSRKNAEITLSAQRDPSTVSAGKTLQFTAQFADPKQICKKAKNDEILWSAVNTETGEAIPAVTISDKGQLKVSSSLEAPVDVTVKAASPIFGTEATYRLTAMPVISAVNIEPAELFFYTGTDTPQAVKVTLDPPIAPQGITWTPNKAGIAEITDTGDGTVSVRPLAAGKISIEVKEPGGKKAKLNVTVADPVTALQLTAKGVAKPGGSVTIAAAMEPKNPGNKAVEWSLDVGEDIAAINDKGQVKISKNAAPGTKITVTCRALGAPEPVTATLELETVAK